MTSNKLVSALLSGILVLGITHCSLDPALEDLKLRVDFRQNTALDGKPQRPPARNLRNQHCCSLEYRTDLGMGSGNFSADSPVTKTATAGEYVFQLQETLAVGSQFSFTLTCALVSGGVPSGSQVTEDQCLTNLNVGSKETMATGWFIIKASGDYECQVPSGICN